jgi:hypothetical protein
MIETSPKRTLAVEQKSVMSFVMALSRMVLKRSVISSVLRVSAQAA